MKTKLESGIERVCHGFGGIREFAKRCDVAPGTVYKWLRDGAVPEKYIGRVMEISEISAADLAPEMAQLIAKEFVEDPALLEKYSDMKIADIVDLFLDNVDVTPERVQKALDEKQNKVA